MTQPCRFTTSGSASQRLAQWGELIWEAVGSLDTQVIGEGAFDASALFGQAGGVHYCQLDATPHRVERKRSAIACDDRDLVKLVVQQRGRAVFSQGGSEALLEAGQWALYDASRPYSVNNLSAVRQLVLLLPRSVLDLRDGQVGRLCARGFGRSAGMSRILPQYIGRLFHEIGEVEDSTRAELGEIAAHLLRLALHEAGNAALEEQSLHCALRLQIRDFVQQHLTRPDLCVETVAAHFHCSKRNIHKVFSDGDGTLAQFIWRSRLQRCREALGDPRLMHRSITEIAYMWGFNNAAHFSKAFKARFGRSPQRYRIEAAAQRAARCAVGNSAVH